MSSCLEVVTSRLRRPSAAAVMALALAVASPVALDTSPAAAAASRTCAGVPATIVGTRGADTITGTNGRDVIVAGRGWDVVRARGGNDLVCAGAGSDTVMGGRGDDRLLGGRGGVKNERSRFLVNDRLVGGAGDDRLVGGSDPRHLPSLTLDTADFSAAQRSMHVDLAAGIARGQGHDTLVFGDAEVIGSRYDDVLLGSGHDEVLSAGAGSDRVDGRGGDDLLRGDSSAKTDHGADLMDGGRGDDYLYAVGGSDTLSGGPGNDQVSDVGRSRDSLHGGLGNDLVEDTLVPGPGQVDSGGAGQNRLRLTTELGRQQHYPHGLTDLPQGITTVHFTDKLTIATTDQFSTVFLPRGRWTLLGTDAPEQIYKLLAGPVVIHAQGGDDYLRGGEGDDLLDGGAGYDVAQALGGDDTCISIEKIEAGPPCETTLP